MSVMLWLHVRKREVPDPKVCPTRAYECRHVLLLSECQIPSRVHKRKISTCLEAYPLAAYDYGSDHARDSCPFWGLKMRYYF